MRQADRSSKGAVHVHCEPFSEPLHTPDRLASAENEKPFNITQRWDIFRRSLLDKVLHRTTGCDKSVPRCIPLGITPGETLIDERTGRPYVDNSIRSSRYTIADFLPKQLLFQCTRLNNFYFIVIGIPQAIPGFSTTGNFTTILPLLFFILLTILKEGYDDLRRHRLDERENKSRATILRRQPCHRSGRSWHRELLIWLRLQCAWLPATEKETVEGEWTTQIWRDVQVGDIIRVDRDTTFPADVILVSTSGTESVALIETMALDGETNLKPKQAPTALKHAVEREAVDSYRDMLVVEQPNKDLYSFEGHVRLGGEVIPLNMQQVILRGSVLRDTHHAVGIVINTGEDCKIRMNANHHPKAKKPNLERWSNRIVLTLIAYVVLLSIGSSIGYLTWQSSTESRSWYLEYAAVPFKQIIIGYGIMYNNIIPLALYISLEIVKLAQMILISSDLHMYDETSQQRARCNTNTILENLGQISYVLTDKTGTLTENDMVFRGISVAGQKCVHEQVQGPVTSASSNGKRPTVATTSLAMQSVLGADASSLFTITQLADTGLSTPLAAKIQDFLLTMALCHTCLPAQSRIGTIEYQASSPDELALVKAAAEVGYRLKARSSTSITIGRSTDLGEVDLVFDILDIIEFSSDRKRMSMLLRYPDGQIWLLSKGADSVIIPRLEHSEAVTLERKMVRKSMEIQRERERRSLQAVRAAAIKRPSVALERLRQSIEASRSARASLDVTLNDPPRTPLDKLTPHLPTRQEGFVHHQSESIHTCFQHLEEFATEGLRTLVFAKRALTKDDYRLWRKLSAEANSAVSDRQVRVEAAAETIERSMELIGVTAIEDRLQRDVPETVEKLRRANMRIWMLTGDKRETALSIAHSSHICCPESLVVTIDATKGHLARTQSTAVDEVSIAGTHSVVIVDGHTLSLIEQSPDTLLAAFYRLAIIVDSVICCRASPSQKSALVQGIREHAPHKLTLTIGDGANDVAMIQTAHVGVGMMGREGMQAARVADYCVAQFSFLQRLLLVHGRWSYLRTAKFILNTFWKEMLFYLPQTLYQMHVGYSGSSLYENWSLTALNTLFTSLCVILPGIFEQDLRAETLLAVPELYVFGQRNRALNMSAFVLLMASATIEGMILWHIPYMIYGVASHLSDNGTYALGHMVFSLAIVWTNWKLLLIDTHTKTKIIFGGFLITVAGWWAWSVFLSGVYRNNLSPFDVRDGFVRGYGTDLMWWSTFLLTLTVLLLTDLAILVTRRYLVMHGHWPLWPATAERRYQARELEAWQEMTL